VNQLKVVNPVAVSATPQTPPANRDGSLAGKRVGLYWNMKSGGDVALRAAQKGIQEKFPDTSFELVIGSVGATLHHATPDDLERIARDFDAVVASTGDCGSCTSWLIHDIVEMEKRGVPATAFVAEGFASDARHSAQNFGVGRASLTIMPGPFTNQTEGNIQDMVAAAIPDVVSALTDNASQSSQVTGAADVTFIDDEWLTYDNADTLEAVDAMNRQFIEFGWSDGFPLRPPTEKALEAMLTGTTRDPDSLVAVLEPGFGVGTVRAIAANAVMAGCRPEHLPVLLAAVECLADPAMLVRHKAVSTGPAAPLLVVNGPIRDQINLNYGVCALGPGSISYANSVIGRALRLVMLNVGHAYPGVGDMDTIGTPKKYAMCIAENEAASPWEPYHVSQGFAADENTVTVQFVTGLCDTLDFKNTQPDALVKVFASAATNVGAGSSVGTWMVGRRADGSRGVDEKENQFLLLAPDHAKIFKQAGWSRRDLQDALYREARSQVRTLMLNKKEAAMHVGRPDLEWLLDSPEALAPVVEDPECFHVAVVGASAGRSLWNWGMGGSVTKRIDG
jgi:hypothetical protein